MASSVSSCNARRAFRVRLPNTLCTAGTTADSNVKLGTGHHIKLRTANYRDAATQLLQVGACGHQIKLQVHTTLAFIAPRPTNFLGVVLLAAAVYRTCSAAIRDRLAAVVRRRKQPPPPVVHECGITPRSSRAPTAGHQAPATGTVYIFCGRGLASHRRCRLSSNVRRHTTEG